MLSNRHRAWMKRTREEASREARAIRDLPGVVSVTIGEKRTGDQRTGKRALVVYVDRKRQVGGSSLIPPFVTIEGKRGPQRLPTDVVELGGTSRALGVRGGDLILCTDGEFGTGSLAFMKNGVGYVGTCAHVVQNVVTGAIFQSALQDPATLARFQLGGVPYHSSIRPSPPVTEDFAVVQTNNLAIDAYCVLGHDLPVSAFGHFTDDLEATYWYVSNGVQMTLGHPEVTAAGVPVQMLVDGAWFPYADFVFLQMLTGSVVGGHSGSLVCRGDGDDIVACGILFGGAPPNFAYVFPLVPMFNRVFAELP